MTEPRYTQADHRRKFGDEVCSFFVAESALHPGEIQINQCASRLIGPLTPAQARELAGNLLRAASVCEVTSELIVAFNVDRLDHDGRDRLVDEIRGHITATMLDTDPEFHMHGDAWNSDEEEDK